MEARLMQARSPRDKPEDFVFFRKKPVCNACSKSKLIISIPRSLIILVIVSSGMSTNDSYNAPHNLDQLPKEELAAKLWGAL